MQLRIPAVSRISNSKSALAKRGSLQLPWIQAVCVSVVVGLENLNEIRGEQQC